MGSGIAAILARRGLWIFLVPLLVAIIGAATWYVASGRFSDDFGSDLERGIAEENASSPTDDSQRGAGGVDTRRPFDAAPGSERADQSAPPASPSESASSVLEDVWSIARWGLLGLGLLAGAVVVARTIARHRRRYARYLIKVGATDRAGPYEVASFFAALHAAVARRAHERLLLGQPAVSFEIHNLVADENHEQRLVLVLPEEPELVDSVRGELAARYPNAEVARARSEEPFWCEQIVRLKKRYPFAPRTLRIPVEEEWEKAGALMDALLKVMAAQKETATVQLVLTPAPRLLESTARALIGAREETLERERSAGRSAGASSEVGSQELAAGAHGLAFEALYFADIRIGAKRRAAARRIGDAIAGNSRDRNQLVERLVHPGSPRRRLFEQRMRRGQPNPLPSLWRNVLSAAELAGLWQLPSIGAHGGALRRHTQPRLEAAPAIRRVAETLALARDSRGGVALWPEDYYLHHLILGVQGSGKTSLLLRQFEVMARDYTRAVILLDPKQDAARRALGLVPSDRPVTFLSLRHPEVGVELWDLPGARPSEVMDAMIWALTELTRSEGGEPQLYASSERFLRYAGIMVQAAYARPTFFHLRHLLSVSKEAIAERERIANLYGDDQEYAAACEHLLEWNEQLKRAGSQQTIRMDAPSNKVAQLTDPLVDRVLRHPRPIDLDRIIREREVLIVEGNIQLGQEMTRTLNLLLLGRIHRALLAQHELPEEQRARTHLLLDEAHVHFSQLLAEMAEVDRAAGLEITAAGQHLAQMRDRYVHKALMSLLTHKSIHRVGLDDARLLTDAFQIAWSDSLRASDSDTTAMPVSPATLSKQPVHQFTAGWTARGEAQPPFTATTFGQRGDVGLGEYHLEEQRSRLDAFEPEKPPPIPAIGVDREEQLVRDDGTQPNVEAAEEPVEVPVVPRRGVVASSASARAGTATVAPRRGSDGRGVVRTPAPTVRAPQRGGDGAAPGDDGGAPVRRGAGGGDGATPAPGEHGIGESAAVTELGSRTSADISDYYRDLARYSGGRIHGFRPPEPAPDNPRQQRLERVDHEIVRAVWTFRALSGPMIRRRYLTNVSGRAARERMRKLITGGLLTRCLITTRGSGADPHVFLPTRRGFDLLRESSHREVRIPSGALYRERELTDYRYLIHDLHLGAWMLAFEELAPEVIQSVEGPLLSRIDVPKVFDRDERRHRNMTVAEITGIGPSGDLVKGLQARPEEWGAVKPDASVHVEVRGRPFDLLIEYEHRSNPNSVKEKLRNYDALLTATWREQPRYTEWGYPPIAIFVCSTPERAVELARVADREVTGRAIERLEDPEGRATTRTRRPGRSRIFFCAEQDVHQRTTRAIRLVQQTADERRAVARNRAEVSSAGDCVELRPFLGREALTRPAM